ncbi:MAG TPA: hypothetical protein VK968_19240 [Roseimicrobium sp.]|nr:hypothetical protein [Roseimicrobium sp.]
MIQPAEPVVVSWSGGKDSAMALDVIRRDPRFEVRALLTTIGEGDGLSGMHRIPRELIEAQASSLGLPVEFIPVPSQPDNATYEQRFQSALIPHRNCGVRRVVFGDLFLEEIRKYREESLLAPLGMNGIYPIWGKSTRPLAEEWISNGFQTRVICVDPKVLPSTFAGRWLDNAFLEALPGTVDPCGENGEFHTFVTLGPGFTRGADCSCGGPVEHQGFWYAPLSAAKS